MKNKLLKKAGDSLSRAAASMVDETAVLLRRVEEGRGAVDAIPDADVKNLKKRQLVATVRVCVWWMGPLWLGRSHMCVCGGWGRCG
jgi:hypothetical protein